MVEESFDIAERGPITEEEEPAPGKGTSKAGHSGSQRIDPTKMTIQRSRQMTTSNSGVKAVTAQVRNKTPTRKK